MIEERIWELLSLQLSGEATTGELEELEKLLKQFPEASIRAELTRNIWNSRQATNSNKSVSFDKHLQRLSNHLSVPVMQFDEVEQPIIRNTKPFISRYKWLLVTGVAASVLICFLLVWLQEGKKPVAGRQLANTVS